MDTEIQERSGWMGGVAKVLNAGGNAVVMAYDATVGVVARLVSAAKHVPVLPENARSLFFKGMDMVKPGEISRLEKKIAEYENQIKQLYFEIGKEGAHISGDEKPLESEAVKKLVADVKEYEKEIDRLKTQIVDIKEDKAAEALRRKEQKKVGFIAEIKEKVKKDRVSDEQINRLIDAAIKKAVKSGEFESRSEMEIFTKVAGDFLDNEMEIKCLAAAELGKIGNAAAVPVLLEAARFEHPDLTAEIVNSLITIGDARAVSLFKQERDSSKYRVRIGCLRGLYKLADTEESMPLLIEALRDDHPEVRRTALTFIGWKDSAGAVPSVIQCLRDEESRVRRAAVSTLTNLKDLVSVLPLINVLGDKDLEVREKAYEAVKMISGEDIAFDVHLTGRALQDAIENLKDWWQKERLGRDSVGTAESETDLSETAAYTFASGEKAPVAAPEVPESADVETEAAESSGATAEADADDVQAAKPAPEPAAETADETADETVMATESVPADAVAEVEAEEPQPEVDAAVSEPALETVMETMPPAETADAVSEAAAAAEEGDGESPVEGAEPETAAIEDELPESPDDEAETADAEEPPDAAAELSANERPATSHRKRHAKKR